MHSLFTIKCCDGEIKLPRDFVLAWDCPAIIEGDDSDEITLNRYAVSSFESVYELYFQITLPDRDDYLDIVKNLSYVDYKLIHFLGIKKCLEVVRYIMTIDYKRVAFRDKYFRDWNKDEISKLDLSHIIQQEDYAFNLSKFIQNVEWMYEIFEKQVLDFFKERRYVWFTHSEVKYLRDKNPNSLIYYYLVHDIYVKNKLYLKFVDLNTFDISFIDKSEITDISRIPRVDRLLRWIDPYLILVSGAIVIECRYKDQPVFIRVDPGLRYIIYETFNGEKIDKPRVAPLSFLHDCSKFHAV